MPKIYATVAKEEILMRKTLEWFGSQRRKVMVSLTKKSVFDELKQQARVATRKNKCLLRAMSIIRKHHTFWHFHKYRRIVNVELQIREKGVQGAFLLLKRYKNRLKAFDETL